MNFTEVMNAFKEQDLLFNGGSHLKECLLPEAANIMMKSLPSVGG
jgi:hypothetical protein